MLGRPSPAEFQSILRNCLVTPTDARRADIIYGPDIAALKGKIPRREAAEWVPAFETVPIPPPVLVHHLDITLCLDFFFVQGLGFYHSISRNIGFRTVKPIADRTKDTIVKDTIVTSVTDDIAIYANRGFHARDAHEFECARAAICPVSLNIVSPDSHHVGEVERSIRTIKERLSSCVHGLPFKRLPKLLIRHMVADAVRCLNQFPWRYGVSDTLNPDSLVTDRPSSDYNQLKLEFGTYVQVLEDNDPSNTTKARSLGAIALDPTGNTQGDYNFLSLATGARISRHQWTALPMTDAAIARVEALGLEDDQPFIQDHGIVVEWRPDQPIPDDEYDRNYAPPANAQGDIDLPLQFDPINDAEAANLAARVELNADDVDNKEDEQPNEIEADDADYDKAEANDDDDDEQPNGDDDNDAGNPAIIKNENDNDNDYTSAEEGANKHEPEADEGGGEDKGAHDNDEDDNYDDQGARRQPRYNLRERTGPTNNFKVAMDNPHDGKSYYPPTQLTQRTIVIKIKHIYGTVMTQMSAKQGIPEFGQEAVAALMQEFSQLEELNAYEAVEGSLLTRAQRRAALQAIHLIKRKRNRKL